MPPGIFLTTMLLAGISTLYPTNTLADQPKDAKVIALNNKKSFFTGLDILNKFEPCGGLSGICIPPGSHYKRLPWGTIPKFCFENTTKAALGDGTYCSPYDVEVYEVTYSDCAEHPVVMCRCRNASVSIHQMQHDFAKVPVKARQHIRSVKALWDTGCWAWNGGRHLCINGPCSGLASVYIHEVGHTMDGVLNGVSASDAWQSAVLDNDTCVPDGYADVAWSENFAQNFVVAAYHHTVKNIWKTFRVSNTPPMRANDTPLTIDCMKHQLSKMIDLTEHIFLNRTAKPTCDRNDWPEPKKDLEYMCMGEEAKKRDKCQDAPDWNMQFYGWGKN